MLDMKQCSKEEFSAFLANYPPKKRLSRNVNQIFDPPIVEYMDTTTGRVEVDAIVAYIYCPYDSNGRDLVEAHTYWVIEDLRAFGKDSPAFLAHLDTLNG